MADDAPVPSPADPIGGGLQHERTALAWERTAIAMMVAGVLIARYAALELHPAAGLIGIAETVGGGLLFYWAGTHDRELHDPTEPAGTVPKVQLTRVVGLSTVAFCGLATIVAVIIAVT
jgi:uncharacterized membrane protein YidH (DUF202 family)